MHVTDCKNTKKKLSFPTLFDKIALIYKKIVRYTMHTIIYAFS